MEQVAVYPGIEPDRRELVLTEDGRLIAADYKIGADMLAFQHLTTNRTVMSAHINTSSVMFGMSADGSRLAYISSPAFDDYIAICDLSVSAP